MRCLTLLRKSTERSEAFPDGLKRAPQHTQDLWHEAEIRAKSYDREVSCAMHMTHMGNILNRRHLFARHSVMDFPMDGAVPCAELSSPTTFRNSEAD